jgi:XTP/dITP diphosphohydrolase
MARVLIATSNRGKLRDFSGAAALHQVQVAGIPDFSSLPEAIEDGATFEANARRKAEHYSRFVPGEVVLADDSGLEVDALSGAPGVHSARYAALHNGIPHANSEDAANNARLLQELASVPEPRRTARFVCVIAAEGRILSAPRGAQGFGYDPLFFFPALSRTFGELSAEEKAAVSHRGQAFRTFLEWYERDLSRKNVRSG